MKKITLILAVMAILTTSCASVPTQIPETMKQACSLYQSVRPDVVRLRAYAADNWDSIPPNVQETLKKLDGYLPALDKSGAAVCAISTGLTVETKGEKWWDDVLVTVIKAAEIAADLKRQGVI